VNLTAIALPSLLTIRPCTTNFKRRTPSNRAGHTISNTISPRPGSGRSVSNKIPLVLMFIVLPDPVCFLTLSSRSAYWHWSRMGYRRCRRRSSGVETRVGRPDIRHHTIHEWKFRAALYLYVMAEGDLAVVRWLSFSTPRVLPEPSSASLLRISR
jgi:hypothetical protein